MMLETCKPQKYEGTLTKLLGVPRGQASVAGGTEGVFPPRVSPRWGNPSAADSVPPRVGKLRAETTLSVCLSGKLRFKL